MAGSVHLWLPANTEEETRFIYLVLHPGVLQCTAFSVFKRNLTQSPTVMCGARPSMRSWTYVIDEKRTKGE